MPGGLKIFLTYVLMKKPKRILLYLSVMLTMQAAAQIPAAGVYIIDSNRQVHDLRNYTYVFADSANRLSANDIISGNTDPLFKPYSSAQKTVSPFTTYWLKVSLKPVTNFQNWRIILRDTGVLYLHGATNDLVDVYTVNNANTVIAHQRTGPLVPRSQKSIPQYTAINCVAFSGVAGQPVTMYIKLFNKKSSPGQLFFSAVAGSRSSCCCSWQQPGCVVCDRIGFFDPLFFLFLFYQGKGLPLFWIIYVDIITALSYTSSCHSFY